MDYCVTFEVSPPPFTPPGQVDSAPRQLAAPAADRYLLPRQVTGDAADVLAGIRAYADRSPALVFDCSRLARIESGAAGHLLALLNELGTAERRIEFRELNHLVAALLRLLGFGDVADAWFNLSPHGDLQEAAANLFSMLRDMDEQVEAIAVSPIPVTGLGEAINDRLLRAAAPAAHRVKETKR